MKISTKKELWNLWHVLENELPEDTDMSVVGDHMKKLASSLNDPIPVGLEDDIFESINSVASFKNFNYFSSSIDRVINGDFD